MALCLQPSLVHPSTQHMFSCATQCSSRPKQLIKQLQALCVLGVAEKLGNDFISNTSMVLRVGDKPAATTSRSFVVTLSYEQVSFSKSHALACTLCAAWLTPACGRNTTAWGGKATDPAPASRPLGTIWQPKCGQWGQDGWPLVPQSSLGVRYGPAGRLHQPGGWGVSGGRSCV